MTLQDAKKIARIVSKIDGLSIDRLLYYLQIEFPEFVWKFDGTANYREQAGKD
jgi:hypothetical protein